MRTQGNRFLSFFLLLIPHVAFAAEIARFDHNVAGFENHAVPGSVLLISQDGQADWLNGTRIERKASYKVLDKICTPSTQDTSLMGAGGGMTLAYPFLVGVERACYIDEKTKSIRLLADFHASLPRNPYSLVYAGADEAAAYFLINGRPYPDGKEGYLELVTIDKQTLKVSVKGLATAVPGYSGANFFDRDTIWITSWPGSIYKMAFSDLHALVQRGGSAPFPQIATEEFHGIDGMSLFMLGNDRAFLYYNGEYESYTVNRSNGVRTTVKPSCLPISGLQSQWLVLCNGNTLESWSE